VRAWPRVRDVIEEELRGPSVLRDPAKLSFDYVPDDLPGREPELKALAQLFKPLLQGGGAQHALLTGSVGVGKTAVAKFFCRGFTRAAGKQSVAVQWCHVNARRRNTPSAALIGILEDLFGHFPDRGFSVDEMLRSLHQKLEPTQTKLLVILDEADVLLKKSGPDLVYLLTRFNEEARTAQHSVSLLLVSQQDLRPLLDEASASTLKLTHHMGLRAYDAEQLQRIAHQRVELAFHPSAVAEEVEELAADIAAHTGSARLVIELLEGAARAADAERVRAVTAEHLRAAKANVESVVTESKLRELDKQKRLALLGIARALRRGDAYVVTGDAEENYKVACEEHGEEARGHTQFWTYLKDLQATGIIDTKRSGKGHAGTTTIITLHDIPARVLQERLEKLLAK
jgi:archaeal cell division control protein 6